MAGSKGNISFSHAHLYVDFDNDISSITGAATATAQWSAIKTKYASETATKADHYMGKVSSVQLPVQQSNTVDIPNMGAEFADKMADLPTLNDAVIEIGWVNDSNQTTELTGKTIGDDISVCLALNSHDAATKGNPLKDSTECTAAVFSGEVASIEPIAPSPGQRASVRITVAPNTKALVYQQA